MSHSTVSAAWSCLPVVHAESLPRPVTVSRRFVSGPYSVASLLITGGVVLFRFWTFSGFENWSSQWLSGGNLDLKIITIDEMLTLLCGQTQSFNLLGKLLGGKVFVLAPREGVVRPLRPPPHYGYTGGLEFVMTLRSASSTS